MRRDWFATGAIVVVATAFAVWYLTELQGCDPVSGVCYQAAWWGVPSLLLLIGIGAGIMVFSIALTRGSNAQEATEAPRPEADARDRKLETQEPDAGGTRRAGKAPPAKDTAGEKPPQDWTGRLDELNAVLQATEERIRSDQEVARARLNHAMKENSTVEPEELIASEAAMKPSPRRLQQPDQTLTRLDIGVPPQQGEARMQNKRLLSIEHWGQEAVRLTKELLRKEKDLLASRGKLLEVEKQLRSEFEALTGEWNWFIVNESSLLESVEQLIADLGPVPAPPKAGSVMSPTKKSPQRPSPPPAPTPAEDTLPSSSPVSSNRKELIGGDLEQVAPAIGPVRVTKNEAMERMKEAARIAQMARDGGRGMTEVREILELAWVSFKAGDFEDTMKHSKEVLEILGGAPPAP